MRSFVNSPLSMSVCNSYRRTCVRSSEKEGMSSVPSVLIVSRTMRESSCRRISRASCTRSPYTLSIATYVAPTADSVSRKSGSGELPRSPLNTMDRPERVTRTRAEDVHCIEKIYADTPECEGLVILMHVPERERLLDIMLLIEHRTSVLLALSAHDAERIIEHHGREVFGRCGRMYLTAKSLAHEAWYTADV